MKSKFIKEILTSKVISVSPETNLSDAVSIMRTNNISCIVLTENKKPVGIFTERDMVKILGKDPQAKNKKMWEVMTPSVLTIKDNINIYELYDILINNNIRHLVVVDHEDSIIGVITQTDIINNLGLEYFFEVKEVSKIMTRKVMAIKENHLIAETIKYMADNTLSCAIIERENKPIGIFTERDAVDLYYKKIDIKNLTVDKVMKSPVITLPLETPLHTAVNLMSQKKIRRVVVVDNKGFLAGLITQFDIVKGLEANYIQFLKDIIHKKELILQETEKDLFEKTAYLENILYSSKDMAIIATDLFFQILYYNPNAEKIFGHKAENILSIPLDNLLEKENLDKIRFKRAIKTIQEKSDYDFMIEQNKLEGVYYIESKLSGIWDKQNNLIGFVLIARDITERKHAEQRLVYMAHYDLLTEIPNRALFFDRLNFALIQAKRENSTIGLFFIDLDNFKHINDNMGHHIGDMVLKTTAKKLSACVRKSDTVARISGDEFAIIITKINDKNDAISIAKKIIADFSQPVDLEGNQVLIGASIGISLQPPDNNLSEKDLLRNADTAMYYAKEQGKNTYKFFEDLDGVN